MIRFIDYGLFSVANFFFGVVFARVGGESALAGYSLSVAIALSLSSLLKAVVINPLSLAPLHLYKKYVSAAIICLFLSLCINTIILIASHYDLYLLNYYLIFIPLFSWFLVIDFTRMWFLRQGWVNHSAIASFAYCAIFLTAGYASLKNMITGLEMLYIFLYSSLVAVIVFIFYFWKRFNFLFGLMILKNNFKKFSAFWLANSFTAHMPVIFIAMYDVVAAGGFYILKTIFNSFGLIFRPIETKYRLSVVEFPGFSDVFFKSYGIIVLVLLSLTATVVVFDDYLLNLIWGNVVSLEHLDPVFFLIYIAMVWLLMLCESMYMSKEKLLPVFINGKFLESILLALMLATVYCLEVDLRLREYVLIISLPMILVIPWIVFKGRRSIFTN